MATVLISLLFILIYSIGLYWWLKKTPYRMSDDMTKYLKWTHYTLLSITLFIVILHYATDLQLRGIWTSRWIIIGLIASGILFYPLAAQRKALSMPEKIYFIIFAFFPVSIAAVLLVPFLGSIINPIAKIHYEDKNIRIQSSFAGVLGPSKLNVMEKKGLFEKNHYQTITHDKHFDSLFVSYDKDATRIVFKSSNKFMEPEQEVLIEPIQ
jgi:hypothetical protein